MGYAGAAVTGWDQAARHADRPGGGDCPGLTPPFEAWCARNGAPGLDHAGLSWAGVDREADPLTTRFDEELRARWARRRAPTRCVTRSRSPRPARCSTRAGCAVWWSSAGTTRCPSPARWPPRATPVVGHSQDDRQRRAGDRRLHRLRHGRDHGVQRRGARADHGGFASARGGGGDHGSGRGLAGGGGRPGRTRGLHRGAGAAHRTRDAGVARGASRRPRLVVQRDRGGRGRRDRGP